MGHAKAFILQEMKCFTSLSFPSFIFPSFPFFGGIYNNLEKRKSLFIKFTKEILELSFSPCSSHTLLQPNQNGIGGSFTSHQQQNNCTLCLESSLIIILPPNLSQYPQGALSSDMRVCYQDKTHGGDEAPSQGPGSLGRCWGALSWANPEAPRVLGVAAKESGLERRFVWVWGECVCSRCSFALQNPRLVWAGGGPKAQPDLSLEGLQPFRAFSCGCGDMQSATSSGAALLSGWHEGAALAGQGACDLQDILRDTEALGPRCHCWRGHLALCIFCP